MNANGRMAKKISARPFAERLCWASRHSSLRSSIFILPAGLPLDVVLLGELNPRHMHRTSRLHVLFPLVLKSPWENFFDWLNWRSAINKWYKTWMGEKIRLCSHINETVMGPIQIGAIIGILPCNVELICLYLWLCLVEWVSLVLLNHAVRINVLLDIIRQGIPQIRSLS